MWRLTLRLAAVVILVTSVPLQGMGEGVPESLGTARRNGTWRELDAPKKDEMLPCYVVLMFLLPVALRLEMLNLGIELGRIGELQERYASIR